MFQGSSAKNQVVRHYCTTTGPSVVGSVPGLEKLPGSAPVSVTSTTHTDLMREVMPLKSGLRHVPARVPISEAIGTAEPRDRGSLGRWFNYQYPLPARKFFPDKTCPFLVNNHACPKVAKICPEANQASVKTPRNIFTNIPRAYRGADT